MLARTDHDFVLGEVRPSRRGQKRRRVQWLRSLFRRPGRVVVGATAAAVGVGILVNALALQGGPHPAPLFKPAADTARSSVLASGPAARPLPPSRPQDISQSASASASPVAAASAPAVRIPAPIPRDPIADMLKGGSNPVPPASIEPNRAVLGAQRALNKLGYGPIKPDGLAGPGTRQAIERFERDRKLPLTGEPSGRTGRDLATASGIPLD
jgi:Putative peptidoglycan binding domain